MINASGKPGPIGILLVLRGDMAEDRRRENVEAKHRCVVQLDVDELLDDRLRAFVFAFLDRVGEQVFHSVAVGVDEAKPAQAVDETSALRFRQAGFSRACRAEDQLMKTQMLFGHHERAPVILRAPAQGERQRLVEQRVAQFPAHRREGDAARQQEQCGHFDPFHVLVSGWSRNS